MVGLTFVAFVAESIGEIAVSLGLSTSFSTRSSGILLVVSGARPLELVPPLLLSPPFFERSEKPEITLGHPCSANVAIETLIVLDLSIFRYFQHGGDSPVRPLPALISHFAPETLRSLALSDTIPQGTIDMVVL